MRGIRWNQYTLPVGPRSPDSAGWISGCSGPCRACRVCLTQRASTTYDGPHPSPVTVMVFQAQKSGNFGEIAMRQTWAEILHGFDFQIPIHMNERPSSLFGRYLACLKTDPKISGIIGIIITPPSIHGHQLRALSHSRTNPKEIPCHLPLLIVFPG